MKKILTFFWVAFLVAPIYAQHDSTSLETNEKPQIILGKFWENWFVSAGAGLNVFIGDIDRSKLSGHLSPALDLSVGKWISPSFGLRLQYNGFSMKTTSDANNWFLAQDSPTAGLHDFKFDYNAVHLEALVNLSSAISGYNPERFYELHLFGGMGAAFSSYKSRHRNEFIITGGLINKFRISQSFDINGELRAVSAKRTLSGAYLTGKINTPLSATIGFTYHFGSKNARRWKTYRTSSNIDITLYQNQINALHASNTQLQVENNALKKQAAEITAKETLQSKVEKVIEKVVIPVPVFFGLNKWSVTSREVASLKYIADYIKENPNSKYIINGYADSQTGKPAFNQNLSDKRAKAIKKVLMETYGVNENQLQIAGKGGVQDLFATSYLNRAVIVVSE